MWDTGWFGTNDIDDLLKNHDLSKLDLEAFANGKLVKKNADGLIKRIDKFVGEVGSGIENHAKITLFMDQVKKGHSFDEAAKTVKQFLFDYGDLTDIERNVFKRVIPFYTFARKNVAAQLQILGGGMGNRQVYANLFKGIENAKEIYGGKLTPEEKALLPEWVQESMYIPLGKDKDGNMKYITSLGLGLEELANLTPSDLMARVNPIIKVPIERISGHSFFTKKPIEESSYYTRTYPGVSELPGIRDYLGTKESERDVYKGGQKTGEKQRVITVNPKRKHLLDAFIGRTYTTVGKIGDDRKTFTERMTNALTGARVSTIDFGEQGYWQDRELMEQLQQQLIDMGYLKEYKSVYKPKD